MKRNLNESVLKKSRTRAGDTFLYDLDPLKFIYPAKKSL